MQARKIKNSCLASVVEVEHEQILVVKRSALMPEVAWSGIREIIFDAFLDQIQAHKEFIARDIAENDPTYKQIIPYLIFQYQDLYFLMERSPKASEQRLQSKLSLGIGGHVRAEDMTNSDLMDWARREFHEEVAYDGSFSVEPLGLLNDDSNDVGRVHLGLVVILKGDSPNISVKSELKSGMLQTLEEIEGQYEKLESWSKFVFEALRTA